jgi:hypothetical protein
MFRNPRTNALKCKLHGKDLFAEIQPSDYHYAYYARPKNKKYMSLTECKDDIELLNEINNDHQHWHLGKTLTFSPLNDLEITRLMLRLPIEDLLRQMTNAELTKELIKLNWPDALDCVSHQKNTDKIGTQNMIGIFCNSHGIEYK